MVAGRTRALVTPQEPEQPRERGGAAASARAESCLERERTCSGNGFLHGVSALAVRAVMAAFPCPISGDFDCADDCCVAPPRRRCPRMFDRAFAAMEKPRSLEASRRIATGVGHVRDAPAHFWPHAKGQGHLGVKLSNTDRANGRSWRGGSASASSPRARRCTA